jgi:hypothetical protein
MQGDEVTDFLDRSLEFTEQLHRIVSDGVSSGTTDLWELTRQAVAQLGPFPEFGHELGAGARAHMALL